MKEKLKKFAKGEFEYNKPTLWFSEDTIEIHVEAGKVYEGTLVMKACDDSILRGLVYSSDYHLNIKESSFNATKVIFHYEYDATELKAGETHVEHIRIVSNAGEIQKTFMAKVEVPYCDTKIGKIRDLFQFTNLAKTDWLLAVKLFKSEEFRAKLLGNDRTSAMIYDGLTKSMSTSHALEEFLISVHKKVRVNITVDKSFMEYPNVLETIKDKLVIQKDNWGYVEIKVTTDAKFIELERKKIWNDNFIGDTFSLEYFIQKENLKKGYNYGNIYIETPHQSYRIEVMAYGGQSVEDRPLFQYQECLVAMNRNYMNFRMARTDAEIYMSEMEKVEKSFYALGMIDECYLLRGHLLMIKGQKDELQKVLDKLETRSQTWEENEIIFRCGLKYLKTMSNRTQETIDEAKEFIESIYKERKDNWRIFWFLLNVDKNLMNNAEDRYLAIREILKTGVRSSLLYYEMAVIYKAHPYFMDELDSETIAVLNWCLKEDFVTKELVERFVFLAGKLKNFHPLVFSNLEKIYQKDEKVETLQIMLGMLVRSQKVGTRYFKWYEAGVKQQVRITQLYESYMYSMPEQMDAIIPESVLLYFSMDCTLDERKKAFLFANILENREAYGEIFSSYHKNIVEFGRKELAKHVINHSLSIIYQELLSGTVLNEQVRIHLPAIMFRYEITCQNDNIVGVVVCHNEVNEETFVPMESGIAQVNIFTDSAVIFLVDKKNNRYYESVEYAKKRYLNAHRFAEQCIGDTQTNGMFLLYLYEQMEEFRKFSRYESDIRNKLLLLDEWKPAIKEKCKVHLIDSYFATGSLLELDGLLESLDFSMLEPCERVRMMELCIVRRVKEELDSIIKQYGYEKIAPKRLYQYCLIRLNEEQLTDKKFLAEICFHVMKARKQSKEIVEFLTEHFEGALEDLLFVWKAANSYGIDVTNLEDRIICQGLFVEAKNKSLMEVFLSYVKKEHSDKVLCRAFISYYCYKNIVFDRVLQDEFIKLLKDYCKHEENELAMLALIRFYSQIPKLTKDELVFVELWLNRFIQKGIILPFFQEFHKQMVLPYQLANQYFVEYHTNPNSTVTIHYSILDSESETSIKEYTEELLTKSYYGIFVKSFVLFQNEKLQYYVTEQNGEEEVITESISITQDKEFSHEENEFNLLNLMLLAADVEDSETLLDVMEQYVEMRYCIKEHFKLME